MIVATIDGLRFWPGTSPVPALDDVSLEVAAGEVVLLRGPSGCGKTTLLRAIAGLVPHFHGGTFQGRVTVDGIDTRRSDVGRLSRIVGSVFQDPETQAVRSTVAADVAFGLENIGTPPQLIPAAVARALELVGADHLADRHIGTLSGGERQRVAIAAAVANRPRILLLDEPTSQLDDDGTTRLMDMVATMAAGGAAVVIAEHRVDRVRSGADRIIDMADGRIVPEPPTMVSPTPPDAPAGEIALAVTALTVGYGDDEPVLRDCFLEARTGRVTVLNGANGSGKSTLMRAVAGLLPVTSGRIVVDGADLTDRPVEDRLDHVALLPQDAGRRLIRERVRDDVADGSSLDDAAIDDLLARLDLTPLHDSHPLDLSVGERERVALANVVGRRSRVLLLDEPSRGLDDARKTALVAVLRDEAAAGRAVVVATHDAAFIRMVADDVLHMAHGAVHVPRPERVGA